MIRRIEWTVIGFIVAAYLAIAGQYATRTPDWQAPDEPAHYNYVRQIVDEHRLPVLEMGDWQQQYQQALVDGQFSPELLAAHTAEEYTTGGIETIEYEDHQPPLYYLLQAPVYALTGGDLAGMRLLSVVLGAGVVLATWATLWTLAPRWPEMALTGAALVAFIPQHLAILSSVSNDALAELLAGLTLLAVTVYLGNSRALHAEGVPARKVHPVVLGVLAGAALLTKTTIYFLAGVAVLAVLLRWRREKWPRRRGFNHLAAVLIPALIMGGVWWGRNLSAYGGTDFTGLARHDDVTVGQPRTADYITTHYGGSTRVYLENYAKTTFRSFWGQFGWMALPMPSWVYGLFLVFTLFALVGVFLFCQRQFCHLGGVQRDALVVFGVTAGCVVGAYLLYNLDFVQFQGRYLYPALIPFALLVSAGLSGWAALAENQFPALIWCPVTAMIGLALFALYALETYIVPSLPVW